MRELVRAYLVKPWPKLEIPPMGKKEQYYLIFYTAGIILLGWFIYLRMPKAGNFFALGAMIPILFLLKNRYFTIVSLLALQVVMAFLFIGNKSFAGYVTAVLIIIVVTFENPTLMYSFLIFAIWFDTSPFITRLSLDLELLIGWGLLFGWFFRHVLTKQEASVKEFSAKWPAILFLGWVLLGYLFWALDPSDAWAQCYNILAHVFFFLLTPLVIQTKKQVMAVIWTWVIVGAMASFATIVGPHFGYQAPSSGWGGGSGVFTWHKNVSASFLLLSFFLNLGLLWKYKKGAIKFGLVGALVLTVAAMILLGSRSAVIGTAIGVALFILVDTFFNPRGIGTNKILLRMLMLIFVVIVFVTAFYLLQLVDMEGMYTGLLTGQSTAASVGVREQIWNASLDIMSDYHHYFRGLGAGAFWTVGLDYLPWYMFVVNTEITPEQDVTGNSLSLQTHSLYMDLLLHYGIPGLILFLWLPVNLVKHLWRGYRAEQNRVMNYVFLGLTCGIIAFFIHSIMDNSTFNIGRYWIYMGLCVVIINVNRKTPLFTES